MPFFFRANKKNVGGLEKLIPAPTASTPTGPEGKSAAAATMLVIATDELASTVLAKSIVDDTFAASNGQETIKAHVQAPVKNSSEDALELPEIPGAAAWFLAEEAAGEMEGTLASEYRSSPLTHNNVLIAAEGGKLTGRRSELLAQIPDEPGTYILCLKAPHSKSWFPIYLGQAGAASGTKSTLRSSFQRYLHGNNGPYAGTIGDTGDMAKFVAVVDAMSRGFSVQFRFHPLPKNAGNAKEWLLKTCNFALNKVNNNARHDIQVKSGRKRALKPISDFPVIHQDLAAVVVKYTPEPQLSL